MKLIKHIKTNGWSYALSIMLLIFVGYYQHVFTFSEKTETEKFQEKFNQRESELVDFLGTLQQTPSGLWSKPFPTDINLHVFSHDSLVYWSTNEMPILRFEDIHFPVDGVLHLQNGWYFAKTIQKGNKKYCASFLIKKDYAYQNKDLINDFDPYFGLSYDGYISLNQDKNNIYNQKGEYIFSVIPIDSQPASSTESIVFMLLFCLLLGTIGRFILWFVGPKKIKFQLILLGCLLVLHWLSLEFSWLSFLNGTEFYDPQLFATNFWLPNFAEYLLTLGFIILILQGTKNYLREAESRYKKQVSWVVFLGTFAFWSFLLFCNKALIENSSIPFEIEELFNLNAYSLIGIASLGFLFQNYISLLLSAIDIIKAEYVNLSRWVLMLFVVGLIYFVVEVFWINQLIFAAIFPLILLSLMLYYSTKKKSENAFTQGLVLLFLFAFCLASNVDTFNAIKERSERELYANQLRTDQDIVAELEFDKVSEKVENDVFLNRFIDRPQKIVTSEFEDAIEQRVFDGFWEQYEMEFYLFGDQDNSLIDDERKSKKQLDEIINQHGEVSEVNANTFFIADYIDQYSYVFKLELSLLSGKYAMFYGTFKSKKIPEEIGFPRLLISDKAKVFESLERYSIAKYYQGKLINQYGEFGFPTLLKAMILDPSNSGYFDYNGYKHYILAKGNDDYLILSSRLVTWVDLLTTFSYLFCFLGLLLLPLLFKKNDYQKGKNNISLALKIQLVMISLVFCSLLIYGWGNGIFVKDQYNAYTNKVITEKLNSVRIEFQSKFGTEQELTIDDHGNKMEYYLQKFSKVFVTDINFYDPFGYLVASSRSRVYNVGLLSEQMNSRAMTAMTASYKSEFVHQERIGKLKYSSAYKPYYSKTGDLLGYLNLQHFGQQKEFEIQIQRFLVAIINVFMFLLAASVVVAIYVSSSLTAPLRLLQSSLSKVDFGQLSEPIPYDKDDEIGALVKEYNQKIDELAIKAQQLAQSERESAWREMAKQVAHEIKNPLTPMKLSLQHFQRRYDPSNPLSKEKLDEVMVSLIEQIDSLTKIANEFSTFAKMPKPDAEIVNLQPLLKRVVSLFEKENILFDVECPEDSNLKVDKDMLVRILNNLVKNAVQSLQDLKNGMIKVSAVKDDSYLTIKITDNGKGIDEEEKKRIFVPYFTTKSNGTGLGLAMVKQMVELHKGTIDFESTVDVGTTFTIRFPVWFNQENK
ncbi:MAG: two-component system nitrogen regulation sensor histidine kinase NtrY [Lentimonas sp.]|jgi:two-component system nitrogen regulation sensor histidine kinase NtrY